MVSYNITNKSIASLAGIASVPQWAKTIGMPMTIQNGTITVSGVTNLSAPLWGGVLVGAVFSAVACLCVVVCCSRCSENSTLQPAYEGLPLITVKTMRR